VTLWKKIDEFSFSYFKPDENSPELHLFKDLIDVWQSKRRGRYVPAWSDFDFFDFKGWHGYLAIYDIFYDPFDYRTRLTGVQFDDLLGRNMTGKNREEFMELAVEDEFADKFYEMACREMLIAHTKGVNVKGREHRKVEFLELPLSDDGRRATQTIEAFIILSD